MRPAEQPAHGSAAEKRTAGEAGWHLSRYNLTAPVPGKEDSDIIVNLFKGTVAAYNPPELYMLSILERLDEHHPAIGHFAQRGIIVNFDEKAALEAIGRGACAGSRGVALTICPTMNCNFSCPYCFENRRPGKISPEVQDDVVNLVRRMLETGGGKSLSVTWFGGEPLLAPDVIESLSERLMALAEEFHAGYSAEIITNGYLLSQKNIDLLDRCRVRSCQVTLDGLGKTNDATRRLAEGGPTFARITDNLRKNKIPFRVHVRQNVQKSNLGEAPEMKAFVEQMAKESGNTLAYAPAPVFANEAAEARGEQPRILCGEDSPEIFLMRETLRLPAGSGHCCGANRLFSVGIDETGRLFKCWENASDPALSFANARDWDPARPLETAFNPDALTRYLNTALPLNDEECRECVWLPLCAGGCPRRRLQGHKLCFAMKNEPEKFVQTLYTRLAEKKRQKQESQTTDSFHQP